MKTVTSLSGGKTSAFLAANYPSDELVFALVRIEDKKCMFPDSKIRKLVEDRIQKPFIATAEEDEIIFTILDLEQFLGKKINWVSGITFDEVIRTKGGWLPNKLHRYCTQYLKIEPIFYWWAKEMREPVVMNIGYRANEQKRAIRMLEKCNNEGLLEYEATFGKHDSGRNKGKNKWEQVAWQKPTFPLIEDGVLKTEILNFWKDKSVRFAQHNNCVGCFHRNPMFLKKKSMDHPQKMKWFASQEGGKNGFWKNDVTYEQIMQFNLQLEIDYSDFSSCDSGFCGI